MSTGTMAWGVTTGIAARGEEVVFVTEDAEGAEALRDWGLEAVERPFNGVWTRSNLRPFSGRRVAVVLSNDREPGDDWCDVDSEALAAVASEVGVFLPSRLEGPQASFGRLDEMVRRCRENRIAPDWFVSEAEAAVFPRRRDAPRADTAARAPAPTRGSAAILVRMADVRPRPLEWLWPGRVPLGGITTIAGDPGLGKSLLTLDLAARVSRGGPWPDAPDGGGDGGEPGAVVVFSDEDESDSVVAPRLIAAGADMRRVFSVGGVKHADGTPGSFTLADVPALEDAIRQARDSSGCAVRLVVIDPVTAYVGSGDDHRNAEVRAMLSPLAAIASRERLAIVLVTHLNKGNAGRSLSRVMGSIAWTAAARAAWAVVKGRDDPARRLLLPIKSNLAAEPAGLAYRLEPSGGAAKLAWEDGPVAMHADDAFGDDARSNDEDGPEVRKARAFLRAALEAHPVRAADLFRDAEGEGIHEKSLRRAKAKEDIEAMRVDGAWWWRYPPKADTPAA